ncbi:MAG TPA: UvrB/UvrC motif-containing protein [Gemmata sp.]|jgi:protein arginine kinase activator|nr:UvrB/UvrC motif-containing protein [Gemmata sp.]
MKCQRCPKQATLHITEVLGEDRFDEVHLCEDCAKKYLYEPQEKKSAKAPAAAGAEEDAPAGAKCPACGMTFLEFRNHGRFGCPNDYDAFKPELLSLMENIHESTRHVGKTPRRAPRSKTVQAELASLRQQLQTFVNDENYEEAARVRDRIKELETS